MRSPLSTCLKLFGARLCGLGAPSLQYECRFSGQQRFFDWELRRACAQETQPSSHASLNHFLALAAGSARNLDFLARRDGTSILPQIVLLHTDCPALQSASDSGSSRWLFAPDEAHLWSPRAEEAGKSPEASGVTTRPASSEGGKQSSASLHSAEVHGLTYRTNKQTHHKRNDNYCN